MENQKFILVTGSNKGIGFGIVKRILTQTNHKVILTSRDTLRGEEAVNKLKEEIPDKADNLLYHQLDITDKDSRTKLINCLKDHPIDILVNNAGVAAKGNAFDTDVFDYTFKTNVFGTIDFTEEILSSNVLKNYGKIIIVGSTSGVLSKLKSEDLKDEFRNAKTNDELVSLANRFREAIMNETVEKDGFCFNTYSVSKMIINTYARVLGNRQDVLDRNIQVYGLCPGWVKTDMAGPNAELTVEEGIVTPMYLIDLNENVDSEKQGKFFYKCKIYDFTA